MNSLKQIKILTALELRNLYGLNVLRFTKDKKAKHIPIKKKEKGFFKH